MEPSTSLRIDFTDADFRFIQKLVAEHAGINLTERKRELVYGRLWKRIRTLELDSFKSYCALLQKDTTGEISHCINAITTNVTSFFREAHHFRFLADWMLQRERAEPQQLKKLRIWSAGCSTGEEPYSIAICLMMSGVDLSRWEIELLATDIDSEVLRKAQQGVYKIDRSSKLTEGQLRFFQKGTGEKEGLMRVNPVIKNMVRFGQLNLLSDWHMDEPFDFIFCRNVIIYFTVEDRKNLLVRFADQIKPGGYLVLGHSESVHGVDSRYTVIDQTVNMRL